MNLHGMSAMAAMLAAALMHIAGAANQPCSISKSTLTQKCGHVVVTPNSGRICPYEPAKCVPMVTGECLASDGQAAYQELALKCPYDESKCADATPSTFETAFAKVDSVGRGDGDLGTDTASLNEVGKLCYNTSGKTTGFVVLDRTPRYCVYTPETCKATPFTSAVKSVQVLLDLDRFSENVAMSSFNISDLGANFASDAFNVTTKAKTLSLKLNALKDISRTTFPINMLFLDVSNNMLTSLGNLTKNAPALQTLVAMSNSISALNDTLLPASLSQLSLQSNRLDSLNGSALPFGLTSLYVNENRVGTLDGVLPPSLALLSLAGNRLSSFRGSFLNANQTAMSLQLQNNQIDALAGPFPPALHAVNLAANKLTAFPNVWRDTAIHSLSLAENAIEWTTASAAFPLNISHLNMSGTVVQGQVLDASKLPPSLVSLDVSNCGIARIEGSFPSSLRSLRLHGNLGNATWVMSTPMFEFLSGLPDLSLPSPPGIVSCSAIATKRINGTYSVCIKELIEIATPAPDAPIDDKGNQGVVVALVGGGALVAVVLVAAFVLYGKRLFSRSDSQDRFTLETAKAPQVETFPTAAGATLLQCGDLADDATLERISLGDDLVRFRIPLPEIEILRPLAPPSMVSQNNKVVLYTAKFNDATVVLKTLTTDGSAVSPEAEAFVNTIRVQSTLNHPKLVAFLGVVWSTNVQKNIVGYGQLMEHLSRGDLAQLLAADAAKAPTDRILQWRPRLPHHRSKVAVLMDIASAVVYLHSFAPAVLHRDIQPKTVFLATNWDAKLSGVGAKATSTPSELITPPEVLKGDSWTDKADVYAFGILMCQLDLGHHPYMSSASSATTSSTRQVATLVMADLLQPTFSPECPVEVQDIATKCLAFDPKGRPTAVQMEFWLRKYRRTTQPMLT